MPGGGPTHEVALVLRFGSDIFKSFGEISSFDTLTTILKMAWDVVNNITLFNNLNRCRSSLRLQIVLQLLPTLKTGSFKVNDGFEYLAVLLLFQF
jgi:hypothetical protein